MVGGLGRLKKVTGVKIIWNFPYFSEVGGFEKVIFHTKKHGLKMPKHKFKIKDVQDFLE